MLTKELMGLLCLAILWINTLLLIGAQVGPLRDLTSRLRRLARSLTQTRVVRGDADGALATHRVTQVGRKLAKQDAILFHDRSYHSDVHGGSVEHEGRVIEVPPADGEVWISQSERQRAAMCASSEAFDRALAPSRKAKGFVRDVTMSLCEGASVWLCSDVDRAEAPLWLSDFDPRPWCRRRVALVLGYQLGVLALASGITYLALYPPLFGVVSTIGGVVGLLYFVLIQPVGVLVRERVLPQHQAHLRGEWKRPKSHEATATEQRIHAT